MVRYAYIHREKVALAILFGVALVTNKPYIRPDVNEHFCQPTSKCDFTQVFCRATSDLNPFHLLSGIVLRNFKMKL